MEHDFWRTRWSERRIHFHQGRPNAFLEQHHDVLGKHKTVLVPLCGKAVDLMYLASLGHTVVGVELVEDAVKEFFAENSLTPEVTRVGAHTRYRHGAVSIFVGDFFTTTRELLGPVDALYDRASIIALPEHMRGRYVEHVGALLPKGAPGLVITLTYPQAELDGPPFSVPEAELRQRYAGSTLKVLGSVLATDGRVASFGERATENCYSLSLG